LEEEDLNRKLKARTPSMAEKLCLYKIKQFIIVGKDY
jgi:hypothetical protein